MNKVYIGIDPSLSSTGLYIVDKKNNRDRYWQIDTKPKDYVSTLNRCLYISDVILSAIDQVVQDDMEIGLITIQDYFSGKQQGVVIDLAQLGTLIRYKLLLRGYPLIVAAPKKIKKFVTGNGNANKQLMMQTVLQRWGYRASTDNLADACGMAHFSQFVYGIWNGDQLDSKQDQQFFRIYLTKQCMLKI